MRSCMVLRACVSGSTWRGNLLAAVRCLMGRAGPRLGGISGVSRHADTMLIFFFLNDEASGPV